ncbi:response regulator transcription factor [Microbacterium sp. ARD31]|uniref:response regulator transcription factor n=1 Tax=Microbacterium sp. ARD31 TaxID=2962576 RepID=UPI0028817C64|nr:response regulator transcription factor [Microbacterium sp. ARD31]MDT0188359.1 response regulator transcription factor [Microbacterium sp. ARD31]
MSDPVRVLLVDDQHLFRAGVRVVLDNCPDLEVVGEADDGFAAVEAVDRLHPDVVLMDVRMPEMDGAEATRQIFSEARASRRARPVRVVVLTTFALDDRAASAIRWGASGFLLKTATPPQLQDAVRTVHAGNAVLGPDDLLGLLNTQFRARPAEPEVLQRLTERERDVFDGIARGLSNSEIARELIASESTIKTHVGSVLRKLGLRDRVQVVVFSYEHGLRR